jgi:hypothetical protein
MIFTLIHEVFHSTSADVLSVEEHRARASKSFDSEKPCDRSVIDDPVSFLTYLCTGEMVGYGANLTRALSLRGGKCPVLGAEVSRVLPKEMRDPSTWIDRTTP